MDSATIKELRNRTGAGMMECKAALEYAEGDEDIAIAYLKAKGLAVNLKGHTFDEQVLRYLSGPKKEEFQEKIKAKI